MKFVKISSKIRLFILVIGTICYAIALFANDAYQSLFINVCMVLLAIQFALQAVELYIKIKEEGKNDEKNK